MQAEGSILHEARHDHVAHGQKHLVGGCLRLFRIELGHVAPDHEAGHLERLQAFDVAGGDMASVAQNRDAIGDRLHLVQAMGDVEDGDALGAQLADDLEQALGLDGRENGRRLVEGDDLMRHQQGASDLHELPVGDGEAADLPVRVDAGAELTQDGARPLAHGRVVDEAEAPDLAPEKEILRDRQVGGEQDLLVNENDALAFRIDRPRERDRLAVQMKIAFRGREMAREDAHQGRLAGAVLPDDRMHLTGLQVERNPAQDLDGPEGFGDALCAKNGFHELLRMSDIAHARLGEGGGRRDCAGDVQLEEA